MILIGVFNIFYFLYYVFQAENIGNSLLFSLLVISIIYSITKKLYMWYNYSNISVPKTNGQIPDFKVDILTTYFPGEPYEMTTTTLKAINAITYPHTTYLCDEADDAYLKRFCQENGIIHVTRDNRINAKAGNINNALQKYATGDICVVLDPDHIPAPNFLDPILPHFQDPEIGFVQIVQSYYNIKESLVARGAAEQTFQFYGPMMMTLNAYGAVNAIGANCVFRRKALDSIGGHAPGLCEDMHTAMLLYAKKWKAVYVPEILAKGLAPSNLTSYFKQQLKWSRGTFDLLVHVYPRIFKNLTVRQRIHYGMLPLHYLDGLIILINFLIPILSLFFSITPWKGNVVDFFLVLTPILASTVLIRTYIQKWVIEKEERGFHIVGGLLHINTWWVYLLGLVYTLINKKVPYLPTPKENEGNTNYKIILPNAIVAILSLAAVYYGISRDLTPFSIFMAGFALFNALIMGFGIYQANRVTNDNRILRNNLKFSVVKSLWNIKTAVNNFGHSAFTIIRKLALPLLLVLLFSSMYILNRNELSRWETVSLPPSSKLTGKYFGIYQPASETGLTDMAQVNRLENQQNVSFNLISFYLGWNRQSIDSFPHNLMAGIIAKNAIPMITWEPWTAALATQDHDPEIASGRKAMKHIAAGHFDEYIIDFIQILKSYDKPVFLRYAHEFDNPHYPWSASGGNTPEEFVAAWKHVDSLIKAEGAHKIMMVWNPWRAQHMVDYYPGDEFVDWVGFTALNYKALNRNGRSYSFSELYKPLRDSLYQFTRKPVMLAEFGSLKMDENQDEWLEDAIGTIHDEYNEVSAIVMFHSAFDKNIPQNNWSKERYLDWTTNQMNQIAAGFKAEGPANVGLGLRKPDIDPPPGSQRAALDNLKAVNYKKGQDWRNNYYVLTREVVESDFRKIRESGFNTVQYKASDIYDYNIRRVSGELGLKLIYQFSLEPYLELNRDPNGLQGLRDDIMKRVKRLKDDKSIVAYSFEFNPEDSYNKPGLFEMQDEYLNLLNVVTREIKSVDPVRPIILELKLNENKGIIEWVRSNLPVDYFGLIATSSTGSKIKDVVDFASKKGLNVVISQLEPGDLLANGSALRSQNFIISNWQDEHHGNWLSFNGLVDFMGNKKYILGQTAALLKGTAPPSPLTVKILKPSISLFPGSKVNFKAVLQNGQEWLSPALSGEKVEFDWFLIKNDQFGNHLAIRDLGSGQDIQIIIPNDYEHYQIRISARRAGSKYFSSHVSSLHTPLE